MIPKTKAEETAEVLNNGDQQHHFADQKRDPPEKVEQHRSEAETGAVDGMVPVFAQDAGEHRQNDSDHNKRGTDVAEIDGFWKLSGQHSRC
ncbi:MAG: hypothetical protein AAGK71_03475 [Pseudomonadota bacterium]